MSRFHPGLGRREPVPLGRLLLLVLAAQTALVALFGTWSRRTPSSARQMSSPRCIWWDAAMPEYTSLPDGAVFATVSPDSFSAALWWGGNASGWPGPTGAEVGGGVGPDVPVGPSFTPSQRAVPAERPMARWPDIGEGPDGRPRSGDAGGQSESWLRLSGSLASLELQPPVVLSVWTNADVLGPTTIQLLVDAGGGVLSAALIPPGSGVAAADAEALQWARQLRFRGGPHAGLTCEELPLAWGTLEYVWHTAEPPARP